MPDLLPALDGDKFTTSDVPDPTMGGLLQNQTARQEMLDADLLTYALLLFSGRNLEFNRIRRYTTYDYFFNSEDAYYLGNLTKSMVLSLYDNDYTYEKIPQKKRFPFLKPGFGIVTHQVTFASALRHLQHGRIMTQAE